MILVELPKFKKELEELDQIDNQEFYRLDQQRLQEN